MTHGNTVETLCLYKSNQLFYNQSQNVCQSLDGRLETRPKAFEGEHPTTWNNVRVNTVTYLHVTLKQASLALHLNKNHNHLEGLR